MGKKMQRDAAELAALLPQLNKDANKYTRGKVLVAGGSHEYPGAAVLAAMASARCGAGYTRLCVPKGVASAAHAHLVSVPVHECPGSGGFFSAGAVEDVIEFVAACDALVVGPGMGACAGPAAFLKGLVFRAGVDGGHPGARETPTVFDADALNIIAQDPDVLEGRKFCVNVLTPHAGEAARLLGREVQDREADALELAARFNAIVVLKGSGTVVAAPDGAFFVDETGGPELAKAGTGDVLGGMVAAFMAQGLEPFDASCLAVHLHSTSGARAAAGTSALSVLPEDVVGEIGPAILSLAKAQV